jgi:hypothetical protein
MGMSADTYSFRRLITTDEFEAAYSIIFEVTEWLLSKGIQQWTLPFPRDLYLQRHELGENYGLYHRDQLAGVVSLTPNQIPSVWEENVVDDDFTWLGTLATAIPFKGQGLGVVLLQEAEYFLRNQTNEVIYLDCYCGAGVLPHFYRSNGYEQLTRKTFTSKDKSSEFALFRKTL